MPSATKRIQQAREQAEDKELPYISKSRLKTYVTCPRKFYFNYILGIRPPENFYMRKGTRIHLVFEIYYRNILDHYTGEFRDYELPASPRDLVQFLPEQAFLYADWLPYIANFLLWELERASNASSLRDWLPVGIEAEAWDDDKLVPWMGFADVIVPAASVAEIDRDDGVVIVDFKTGKTPDKKYRNKGIFLEGEYYGMLFEDDFDVAGVAGYFPKNHDFVVAPLDAKRRAFIRQQITNIHAADGEKALFPPDTGPLCKWGPGEGEDQCDYYSLCSAGREWGGPGERPDEFLQDLEDGRGTMELANKYCDGNPESVNYWTYKLK